MNIVELKNKIENKSIDNSFMIWRIADESSKIITDQYIHLISNILKLNICIISSTDEIQEDSFIIDDNLYIMYIDEWNVSYTHDSLIIICNKTKDARAIDIPKLEMWQLVDLVKKDLIGINSETLEQEAQKYSNVFRFLNDMRMVAIFDKNNQREIFNGLMYINDNSNYQIWDLSNAIIKKDLDAVRSILKHIDSINIEPLALSKVLYNNFKNILSIQVNPFVTAADLGVSDKQYFVIKKYNCGYYDNESLIDILELLTNIEVLFKYEGVDINYLIDYVLVHILKR